MGRTVGRLQRDDLAVAVHDERGMDETVLEAALDRHRLVFGDERSVFALTSGFDESAATGVLENEFVAEDLSHLTFDLDRARVRHGGDRDSRQRRIGGRRAAMPMSRRDGANANAERENRDGCGCIDSQPRQRGEALSAKVAR
jgi:hypothetical protein